MTGVLCAQSVRLSWLGWWKVIPLQAKTSWPVEQLQGGDDRTLIEASHWSLKAHPGHVFVSRYTHSRTDACEDSHQFLKWMCKYSTPLIALEGVTLTVPLFKLHSIIFYQYSFVEFTSAKPLHQLTFKYNPMFMKKKCFWNDVITHLKAILLIAAVDLDLLPLPRSFF